VDYEKVKSINGKRAEAVPEVLDWNCVPIVTKRLKRFPKPANGHQTDTNMGLNFDAVER
jgi:hypothetical protein